MNFNDFEILPVLLSLALILVLATTLWLFIAYKKLRVQLHDATVGTSRLRHDFAGLCSAAVNVDSRLADCNFQFLRLKNRVDNFELSENQPHSYQMAISKVRNGENTQSLVEQYGFAFSEAELLVRLYRNSTDSGE